MAHAVLLLPIPFLLFSLPERRSFMSQPPLVTLQTASFFVPLKNRTGKLAYSLTNDYLFKVILQNNEDILRALLGSLLGLPQESIQSVIIMNTIDPGATIHNKETILDIKLVLNHQQVLNLEMQVKNEYNWPERSLTYLCRSFDQIQKGRNYGTAFPTHHISILGFSLNGTPKQFYSHYCMMEQRTHHIYTDKFRLSVLDLTQAALATEPDRQLGLDLWATAFRATNWEEFQMLAEKDPLFEKVSDALYIVLENKMLADQIRRQWEAEADEKRRKENEQRLIRKQKRMEAEQKRMAADQKRMKEDKVRMQEDKVRMEAEINSLRLELAKAKSALAENAQN